MAAPNSPTDIVNLSLDLIKTETVNDIEAPGTNKAAVVANRWYDITRRDALEGYPWNFATTRDSIALNATAPDFEFGLSDAYVLPNNYLSLNFIKYWWLPLSQWDYVIEEGNIYIDNGGATSLDIGYIFDETDVVQFPPSFKMYLAAKIAEVIVYKITSNPTLQKRMVTIRQEYERSAKAKNGKVNPPVAFRRSKLLEARRRYAGPASGSHLARPNGRN